MTWVGYTGRCISRCPNKHVIVVEGPCWAPFCGECGGVLLRWKPVKGTRTSRPCGARCTGGRSSECNCECGGENHGSSWLLMRQVTA